MAQQLDFLSGTSALHDRILKPYNSSNKPMEKNCGFQVVEAL
jgi:hypothetical protein